MEEIIKILKNKGWTIGVMESCTGGAIANSITNISGSSDVFSEGRVTYSLDSKVKAGVDRKIVKKFGIFSRETAEEMARKIGGNIAVGITGNLNEPGEVFIAVRIEGQIKSEKFKVISKKENKIEARIEMKAQVVEKVIEMIIDNI